MTGLEPLRLAVLTLLKSVENFFSMTCILLICMKVEHSMLDLINLITLYNISSFSVMTCSILLSDFNNNVIQKNKLSYVQALMEILFGLVLRLTNTVKILWRLSSCTGEGRPWMLLHSFF